MQMTYLQMVAMNMALANTCKQEDYEARLKLLSGAELSNGDCRALIVACNRDATATEQDVKQLAEWFFERYGFDDKVKIVSLFKVEFS